MTEETRRRFLDHALKGGLVVYVGGMLVPVTVYLMPASQGGAGESLIPAGPAEPFEPGTARLIKAHGKPIIVLRGPAGEIRAFSAICTHLGCIVHWDPGRGKIVCPCHAATFGPHGQVLSGPPSKPLPEYEVVRIGDELRVRV